MCYNCRYKIFLGGLYMPELVTKAKISYESESKASHSFSTNSLPPIILASKSVVRKQQLIDENISFEIIVSNADETPDNSKSFKNQLGN